MQEQENEDRIQEAFRGNQPKIFEPKIIQPKPIIPEKPALPIKPLAQPKMPVKSDWTPINFAHKKEIAKGLREKFGGKGIVNAGEIKELGKLLRGAKGQKTINKRLKEAGFDKFHRGKLRGLGKMMKKPGKFF